MPPELSGFSRGSAIFKNHCFKTGGGVPNATRYQLRYASIFSIFRYFRKWSNMWSSHLFRTFCRKVYRPNCQVFRGIQRFSKITALRPVAVSRIQCATTYATLHKLVYYSKSLFKCQFFYCTFYEFFNGYPRIGAARLVFFIFHFHLL